MTITTKTRPVAAYRDEAARAKLKAARATLVERQAVHQTAEAAHEAALHAYRDARGAVDEIQARVDDLALQYRQVHPMGREEIQRRVDECRQPLHDAKAPLMALGIEAERTAKALVDAESTIAFYRSQQRAAAEAVVRAEAPPVAEPMVPVLRNAIATLLAHGPEVLWMADDGMIGLDEDLRRVLNLCQSWEAFAGRYHNVIWRGAAAVLEADPDAAIP